MKKVVLLSLAASAYLMASGYKIPENSTNAVALSAANVAHNHNSADAAFYNPAKMVFMSDENHIDANVMYIGLDKVKFTGTQTDSFLNTVNANNKSKSESFIVPSLHYVSKKLGESGARVGLSIVSPAGLSKRWESAPQKTSAEEFTLKTIEINPSVAIQANEKLAFAFGFRIVRSDGVVKSNGKIQVHSLPIYSTVTRDMTGDSIDYGYNLAVAYNPTEQFEVGVTYRSKIDLNLEGNANLSSTTTNTGLIPNAAYNGAASVTVPLPATFTAAVAYTFPTKTTVEFVYERTYWSAYSELDFQYPTTLGSAILTSAFDNPKAKNWKDTNAYRVGITQELEKLTLMGGLVIDNTPVPDSSLSYELPDSDSVAVSLGARYKINEKIDVGLSAIYSMRESRTIAAANNDNGINGEFSDGNVLIVSTGLSYKF